MFILISDTFGTHEFITKRTNVPKYTFYWVPIEFPRDPLKSSPVGSRDYSLYSNAVYIYKLIFYKEADKWLIYLCVLKEITNNCKYNVSIQEKNIFSQIMNT